MTVPFNAPIILFTTNNPKPAYEVVRLLINKVIVLTESKKLGPGYKRVKLHKALTYTKLKKQNNNTQTVKHLKNALE